MYKRIKYVKEVQTCEKEIVLFNPLNASFGIIPSDLYDEYYKCKDKDCYDIKNEFLINNFFCKEEDFSDEKDIINAIQRNILEPDFMQLTIMPTEQCNFRCVYCYEGFKKGKMAKQTADAIVSYIEENISNYKGITISWFGGEPLLAVDIIEYISDKVIAICKKYRKMFIASMTTNGFLLNLDNISKLYKMHVYTYQITLDGTQVTHDRQRILCGGGKTFDTIVNNLLNIKKFFRKKFLRITLRTNLTKEIIAVSLDDYINFIQEHFANDVIFDFLFRIAWTNDKVKIEKQNIFIESEFEAYKYLYSKLSKVEGLSYYDELSQLLVGGGVCNAAKKGYYIFGSDGMIYKCTVHFDDVDNQLGYISNDGEVIIDEAKKTFWEREEYICLSRCHNCDYIISCLGISCPYKTYKGIECNEQDAKRNELIIPLIAKSLKCPVVKSI